MKIKEVGGKERGREKELGEETHNLEECRKSEIKYPGRKRREAGGMG